MTCVILLSSIHRVMKAEKLLKGRGLEVDLIPVPREISSDCGVAIELPVEIGEEALRLMDEYRMTVSECYTRDDGGRFEKRASCVTCCSNLSEVTGVR
jgi:hypothetical protein